MKLKKTLTLLLISLFFASFFLVLIPCIPSVKAATGQNWLLGWTYRQSHVINSASGAGTGYQVNITAYYGSGSSYGNTVYLNSHSQANFGDIRFTASDGSTLLNYWLESYTASNVAVFWVQLDSVTNLGTTSETIYVYYGNSTVSTTSSPTSTFALFDNFANDGGTINSTLWTTKGGSNAVNITNNSLLEDDVGRNYSCLNSTVNFPQGYAVMAVGNTTVDELNDLCIGFDNSSSVASGEFVTGGTSNYYISSAGNANGWGTTDTNTHAFLLGRNLANNKIYAEIDNTATQNYPDQISGGHLNVAIQSQGYNIEYVQWVAVRYFVYPEPVQAGWGTEEVYLQATPTSTLNVYPITGLNSSQGIRWQSKAFTALGRFWVFYDDEVFVTGQWVGQYFYTSSVDGQNWATPTYLNCTYLEYTGDNLIPLSNGTNVWIFGAKGYMAFGTLNSNGTINFQTVPYPNGFWWDSSGTQHNSNGIWQALPPVYIEGTQGQVDSYATLDSNGYPWFVTGESLGSTLTNITTLAWKDIYNNGSWAIGNTGNIYNATAVIPGNVAGTANSNNGIIPLANGQVYIFSYYAGQTVYGYLWNGNSLSAPETISTDSIVTDYNDYSISEGYGRAITVDSLGNIFFAFPTTSGSLVLDCRNYQTGTWTEQTVENSVIQGCSPALGWVNGVLFLYWIADSSQIASEGIVNDVLTNNVLVSTINGTIPLFNDLGYNGRLNAFSFQYGQQSAFLFETYSTSGSENYTLNLGLFTSPLFVYSSSDANSVITPSGYDSVSSGASQTFNYSAKTGYTITEVLVDGSPISLTNYPISYTFNDITTLHTIIVYSAIQGPIIVSNNGNTPQYFFRSDTYHTLGVSGYGFDSGDTYTPQTISEAYSGTGSLIYGFQVYLFSSPTQYSELTSGPSALITINGNYTGYLNSTFNIPLTPVILGYQALQINVEIQLNGSVWATIATFVSPVLITNNIQATTWQFNLYVNNQVYGGNTYPSFSFGNSQYTSGVSGISFSKPLQSDIAMWRLQQGDYVGWILGEYTDELGFGFYGLILFAVSATLYFRYKNSGVILFFFATIIVEGGFWWLLPPFGAAVAGILLLLIGSFLLWRLLR
jgi:hypothetical protein